MAKVAAIALAVALGVLGAAPAGAATEQPSENCAVCNSNVSSDSMKFG